MPLRIFIDKQRVLGEGLVDLMRRPIRGFPLIIEVHEQVRVWHAATPSEHRGSGNEFVDHHRDMLWQHLGTFSVEFIDVVRIRLVTVGKVREVQHFTEELSVRTHDEWARTPYGVSNVAPEPVRLWTSDTVARVDVEEERRRSVKQNV